MDGVLAPHNPNRALVRNASSKDALNTLAEVADSRAEEVPERPQPVLVEESASSSGVSISQYLSMAFRVCPEPSPEQLERLADRIGMTTELLHGWFVRRRLLEAFVKHDPSITASDIATVLSFTKGKTSPLSERQAALLAAVSWVDRAQPLPASASLPPFAPSSITWDANLA